MLRSTFYSFTTALRGLNTAQKQLDITGQNISNVGTTGYTRQRADVYAATPGGYGDRYGTRSSTQVGQGVIIGSISQCRDPFLDIRFRREAANLGEQGAKLDTMEDLSLVFDEIEKSGLMSSFNDFVAKLQSLAGNAESSEFDSIAKDAASTLIKQFNQYASQISTVREETEYNLSEVTVKKMNDLMSNIANLNKSIREVQSSGGPALELKDERNLLLDELSNYVKLDVNYDPKEIAGGIIVEDVSISMVGANGKKEPLIFNDAAATINVKTKGQNGSDKAVVTVDNSALPAKEAVNNINNLLQAISDANKTLASIDQTLGRLYPKDADATPTNTALHLKDLDKKLATLGTSITNFNASIPNARDAVKNAQEILDKAMADKKTPPEIKDAQVALDNASKELARQEAGKTAALKEQYTLNDLKSTADKQTTNISSFETSLRGVLAKSGNPPTGITLIRGNDWDVVPYADRVYGFEDKNGVLINDKDGKPLQWNVGSKCTQIDRNTLATSDLNIVFSSGFNVDDLDSPGSLKGSIDMLNSEGIFDFESNQTRGIGYYEKMLDSLAEKLATTLNKINDKPDTTMVENMFQTSDGSSQFTAANLKIADGWLNGQYGITGTKKPIAGDNSAKNDNILLMISTISSKMQYSTGPIAKQDANGNYLKIATDGTTSIAANGRDKDGNYIRYTYDADGKVNGSTKVCNKDMVAYKADGTLDVKKLTPNPDTTKPGTYLGTDGKTIIANGRDKDGNYTMTTQDADGKDVTKLVANDSGILYQVDNKGEPIKDKDGNLLLDKTMTDQIDFRAESFLYNGTFQEFLSNTSNVLSLDISSTSNLAANHQAVLDSVQTSKDSISSVSLDEEGVNIMQFQKAYNAAARLMTALDEAVERIINQMGTVGR